MKSITNFIGEHRLPFENRNKPALTPLTLVAVQFLLFLGVITTLVLYHQYFLDLRPLVTPVCWLIVLSSLWAFYSWKLVSGAWLDPYSLFLLSAVIFNGGLAFLQAFHLNALGPLENRFRDGSIVPALMGVAIGISSMHLGALITSMRTMDKEEDQSAGEDKSNVRSLSLIGWCMLCASIVPMFFVVTRGFATVSQSGYSSLYSREFNTGLRGGYEILASFFVPSLLFLLAGNNGRKVYVAVPTLLMSVYSVSLLVMGWRYNAIAPAVAFLWIWDRTYRPLQAKLIFLCGAFLLLFVFPFVQATRNSAIGDRPSPASVLDFYRSLDNPAIASISEMGGTLDVLACTIDLVPSTRRFNNGVDYLYGLSTIIPNVMWDIHPAIAREKPSTWLIRTVNPFIAAAGGTIGFSFIAEAYLNFGFFGIPFVLFTIGLFYARFVIWGGRSRDPAKIAMVGSYMAYFLMYARSDSVDIIRPFFWYACLPYALILLFRRRKGYSQ